MRKVSTREIRSVLPHLEEALARDGELIVTRRGKAVARLLPVAGASSKRPNHSDLRARMPRLEAGSEATVRADRDER